MVDYILKYRTGNLIIIYCYAYSKLLGTTGVIIQNSIDLARGTESGPWVDR